MSKVPQPKWSIITRVSPSGLERELWTFYPVFPIDGRAIKIDLRSRVFETRKTTRHKWTHDAKEARDYYANSNMDPRIRYLRDKPTVHPSVDDIPADVRREVLANAAKAMTVTTWKDIE